MAARHGKRRGDWLERTEYNVDARSTWVFAFDRAALCVYRSGGLCGTTR